MNTAEFLMIASSVVPDRDAMVCEGQSRNFAEMQERVNRLANALQSLGVGKGARAAVMALNSMQYVEIYYACAKLGAVFVPLNYRAKEEVDPWRAKDPIERLEKALIDRGIMTEEQTRQVEEEEKQEIS